MLKTFYENKAYGNKWEQPPIIIDSQIVSVTGSEVVTVSEAKAWALIDTSADDTIIGYMITSVRQSLENYISRDIVAKSRKYYIEQAIQPIALPFAPIDAISAVTHTQDNTALTITDDYYVRGLQNKVIDFNSYPKSFVTISYTTLGITDQAVKDSVKATFEYLYNSRGLVSMDSFIGFEIPSTAKHLINGYKKSFL
jgi:hypothetical protein